MTAGGVTTVFEACNPYPAPRNSLVAPDQQDVRHARWLSEVLNRLDERELRQIARTLAVLNPRVFEQELVFARLVRKVMEPRNAEAESQRLDSASWTCRGCGGPMIGNRPPDDLCASCVAAAITTG